MDAWAIRDIKHGKTYYFKTIEQMIEWVKKLDGDSREQTTGGR